MYSEELIAAICIGGLALTTIAVLTYVAWRQRNQQTTLYIMVSTYFLNTVVTGIIDVPHVYATTDESQPLLNASAIRTRYATNPNEFARSYIGRTECSSFMAQHSVDRSVVGSPLAIAEHFMTVVPSDSSDSEDSSMDSYASDSGIPEPTESDNITLPSELASATPRASCISEINDAIEPGVLPATPASILLADEQALHEVAASGIDNKANDIDHSQILISGTSAMGCGCSASSNNTVIAAKPAAAEDTSVLNWETASTLSAQARVFVPGRQHRVSADADANSLASLRQSVSEAIDTNENRTKSDYISEFDATIAQTQALRQSTVSSIASSSSSINESRHRRSTISTQSTHCSVSESTSGTEKSSEHDTQTESPEIKSADLAAEPSQQAPARASAKRRCRFWPSCSNRNCKYAHPSQTCRAFPNCSFGTNCIYIHPGDVQKINLVISRAGKKGGPNRPKRKNTDIVRLNNLSAFVN
ncbi:hypothetical protein BX661DRAFT_184879 [Kickxella alabastrina]|uniref:uncharacterized protein n=1 Tax=Kickxella alabastrina TaxID=61397 RepID=UPI002220EF96|nr:uncharacterized protein BX661DRAFT_184879 [Kickxella alabastrina]KAI7825602.1 hypothetical protein BX661DRAFT_184879 [Kickxella alabastrina]